ncbi:MULTISPECIES: TetR/AcrR family transcriptional regulator [unclassified Arthrobacter]|uniref:TetR/AcrR family transcriptional regulator n=1 Tax=unclassified Arthrobacter TaxID=235627 RepID=UPI001490C8D9|nr:MULTISPECIES: TetR/AcrR family transcriptional regulator [unclassified Arthrobacter]MBE0009917.1 TetR/AcrR family transcriptional regulator [Arthrobacter sp. AET 35A]NOJ63742.1 TetR/AcrR family transcriptional regulator [Arthrobacter sp. 147(2020)]
MARPRTQAKIFEAVLTLAAEQGFGDITMEGLAARAGLSKQTLYRTWPSTGAILFDALLAQSLSEGGEVDVPNSGDLSADLELLATAAIAELRDPVHERLLRAVTADMQTDEDLASQFQDRLLSPQLRAVSDRFRQSGIENSDDAAELLLGPILHRWLLRTRPFDPDWVRAHVGRVLRATMP